jgi:hypothetical protein
MTFIENWDFSLQANNDSLFDWTGFARLTYRMGGSRRRNVPDQMEQPMMRNEHIVRAHRTPVVAINPSTGTPWRVFHVNNVAGAGGDGSLERPFNTLAAADTAATMPWDIVYVNRGDGTATGYDTPFSFNAANQYLVGNGSTFFIPAACCGTVNLATDTSGLLPLLSNPAGPSVSIAQPGATVANFQITGSDVGIAATGNLTGAPRPGTSPYPGVSNALYQSGATIVSNVTIASDGTAAGQSGVELTNATGAIAFTDTSISDMSRNGLLVQGGAPTVQYQGSISNSIAGSGPVVEIRDTTGGDIAIATGSPPGGSKVPNQVVDTGGEGILISQNAAATKIDIDNVSLTDNASAAIAVLNDASTTFISSGAGTGISKTTPGAAITLEAGTPTFSYLGAIKNAPTAPSPASFLVNVSDLTGGDVRILPLPGAPFTDTGDGIQLINNANAAIEIGASTITSRGAQGVLIDSNANSAITLTGISVNAASTAGVLATNSPTTTIDFRNLNVNLTGTNAIGLQASKIGAMTATFTNSITTASTTQPAVQITDSGPLTMTFTTISSAVTGTNPAMEFLGTTNGNFNVTSAFLVSGTTGTAANVDNSAGVSLVLPPP